MPSLQGVLQTSSRDMKKSDLICSNRVLSSSYPCRRSLHRPLYMPTNSTPFAAIAVCRGSGSMSLILVYCTSYSFCIHYNYRGCWTVLVQCIIVNPKLLLTTFQACTGKWVSSFYKHACRSFAGEIQNSTSWIQSFSDRLQSKAQVLVIGQVFKTPCHISCNIGLNLRYKTKVGPLSLVAHIAHHITNLKVM